MESPFPPLFVPLVPVYIAPPYPPTSWPEEGEHQHSEQDTEALTEIGSVVGSSVDTEARNEHPWDDGTYAQARYV